MTRRPQGYYRSRNRNVRWQRRLQQLAQMRAAKARKRDALIAAGWTPEPRLVAARDCPLELGVRDKRSGEVAWVEFRSVRDALRRLSVVRKFYQPLQSPSVCAL